MTFAVRYFSRSGNTKKIAEENNVQIMENEFHCKGKFSVMHKNRPNEKDLEAAKAFARTLTK